MVEVSPQSRQPEGGVADHAPPRVDSAKLEGMERSVVDTIQSHVSAIALQADVVGPHSADGGQVSIAAWTKSTLQPAEGLAGGVGAPSLRRAMTVLYKPARHGAS